MPPVKIQTEEDLKLYMYTGKKDNYERVLKPQYMVDKAYREKGSATTKLSRAKLKYGLEIADIFQMDNDSRLSIVQSKITTKECNTSIIHQYKLNPSNYLTGYDIIPNDDFIVPTLESFTPCSKKNSSLLTGIDFSFSTISIAHGPDRVFTGVPAFGFNFRFYHTADYAYARIEKLYREYDWIFPKDKDFTIKIWRTTLKYGNSPVELVATYEVDDEDFNQLRLIENAE